MARLRGLGSQTHLRSSLAASAPTDAFGAVERPERTCIAAAVGSVGSGDGLVGKVTAVGSHPHPHHSLRGRVQPAPVGSMVRVDGGIRAARVLGSSGVGQRWDDMIGAPPDAKKGGGGVSGRAVESEMRQADDGHEAGKGGAKGRGGELV